MIAGPISGTNVGICWSDQFRIRGIFRSFAHFLRAPASSPDGWDLPLSHQGAVDRADQPGLVLAQLTCARTIAHRYFRRAITRPANLSCSTKPYKRGLAKIIALFPYGVPGATDPFFEGIGAARHGVGARYEIQNTDAHRARKNCRRRCN